MCTYDLPLFGDYKDWETGTTLELGVWSNLNLSSWAHIWGRKCVFVSTWRWLLRNSGMDTPSRDQGRACELIRGQGWDQGHCLIYAPAAPSDTASCSHWRTIHFPLPLLFLLCQWWDSGPHACLASLLLLNYVCLGRGKSLLVKHSSGHCHPLDSWKWIHQNEGRKKHGLEHSGEEAGTGGPESTEHEHE